MSRNQLCSNSGKLKLVRWPFLLLFKVESVFIIEIFPVVPDSGLLGDQFRVGGKATHASFH